MTKDISEHRIIRWFDELPESVRHPFYAQWMLDEAGGISNSKLANCLTDRISSSDALIKGFRAFDLEKKTFKKVTIPARGYKRSDVEQVCNAINSYRQSHNLMGHVSVSEFYQRARNELHHQYPIEDNALIQPVDDIVQPAKPSIGSIKNIGLVSMALLAVGYFFWLDDDNNPAALEQQTYQQYLPGNVVQLRQLGQSEQLVMLKSPEHYLSASSCYPKLEPESKASSIVSYDQLQALPMNELDHKTFLLPDLSINDVVLNSNVVRFGGLNQWHINKGMINLGISETCLASMQQVIDYGNRIDDYAIIKQAFVADVIHLDMVFSGQATEAQIAALSDHITAYFIGKEIEVVSGQNSQGKTRQIIINGPVMVAYISQQMSARISM